MGHGRVGHDVMGGSSGGSCARLISLVLCVMVRFLVVLVLVVLRVEQWLVLGLHGLVGIVGLGLEVLRCGGWGVVRFLRPGPGGLVVYGPVYRSSAGRGLRRSCCWLPWCWLFVGWLACW